LLHDGEKIEITGSGEYNGTYYYKASDDTLYTDQALTTALDASGFATFAPGGTLTMSQGQYFDAAGTSPAYYYIGNDDEQIFRSSNGITWTQQADVTGEFFNDFAYGTFSTNNSVLSPVQGEYIYEFDGVNTDLTITNLNFNLLFCRTANAYSGSATHTINLPAGTPGQRLVVINITTLCTLVVAGGDGDSSVTVDSGPAEFIYTTNDGWMALYGTV
jgi:hypothetical protein